MFLPLFMPPLFSVGSMLSVAMFLWRLWMANSGCWHCGLRWHVRFPVFNEVDMIFSLRDFLGHIQFEWIPFTWLGSVLERGRRQSSSYPSLITGAGGRVWRQVIETKLIFNLKLEWDGGRAWHWISACALITGVGG